MSMNSWAILVLFAMSAAELIKKRSGVWSANINSVESSERRHIRDSAGDGECLQLAFSLLCTSSHNINKFAKKQTNAQTVTPEAAPSAPEGSCVMVVPLLGWASAVSEPGFSWNGEKQATEKSKRRRGNGQERGRRCRNATRESGPVLLVLSARRNALGGPIRGLLAHMCTLSFGRIDTAHVQTRQSRTRESSK